MEELGLVDVLDELRRELVLAAQRASAEELHFPVEKITVQLQLGVTHSTDLNAGVKFWVLGMGGSHEYARESAHTIIIELGPPLDTEGRPFKVASGERVKPA